MSFPSVRTEKMVGSTSLATDVCGGAQAARMNSSRNSSGGMTRIFGYGLISAGLLSLKSIPAPAAPAMATFILLPTPEPPRVACAAMSHFFAYLARMKFIRRWGLMRNTRTENIQEHSLQVAMIAHGLAVIRNERFGGAVDPARVALLAVYHDAEEVITGDLPTPVKYFSSEVRDAFASMSGVAQDRLLGMLPAFMRPEYEPLLRPELQADGERELVKAADRLCAYLKCIE